MTKKRSKISSGSQTGFARSGPIFGYGEAVDVVGHDHKTEQVPTELPDRLLQSLEQTLAVTLVLKDGSPAVATGHRLTF